MVVLQALTLIPKIRSFHVRSHPTTASNGAGQSISDQFKPSALYTPNQKCSGQIPHRAPPRTSVLASIYFLVRCV